MTTKGEITMDWNLVSIEEQLDREKAEREKENSKIVPAATGSKLGCLSILLYIGLGILIFRLFVEVVSIFSR